MNEFYGSLHCHSDYSNFRLRDATGKIRSLCDYALELGHNCIAITDHETIANAIECEEVEKKIREKNPDFKVIKGNEIYLCRNGLNSENFIKGEDYYYHAILIAKNARGHEQLREISTRAWLRSYKTGKMMRVPTYYQDIIDIIGKEPGNVIFSTACLGSFVDRTLLKYMETQDEKYYETAKSWCLRMMEIVGEENFFLETQPSYNKEQIFVNQQMKKLSLEIGRPVIITLDVHYVKKTDAAIHKAFLNSQGGERETELFYASTYLMSREEIHSYMDNFLTEETVSEWMNNTKLIYDMCEDYSLLKPLRIPYLPKTVDKVEPSDFLKYKDNIKNLEYFYKSQYAPDRDLAAAIIKKIKEKPQELANEKTYKMIDECLTAIKLSSEKQNTQWSAYLLNMRDYIRTIWDKGNSLVGPSRGSGGGFILLYILDIIQINPAREKAPLKPWRFLNPERVSPLD